jgi:biotin carboxyl carrier protein
MKLNAELAGQQHELKIQREGPVVYAEIDGRQYRLELRESDTDQYLLLEDTRVHDCRVDKNPGHRDDYTVTIGPDSYEIRLIDPKRLRSAHSARALDHGAAEIVAPMPGRIVRVLVEPGTRVEAGAGIVVVEAMKMQNEMKAPKAGIVLTLKATAGTTVNAGDVLAIVE